MEADEIQLESSLLSHVEGKYAVAMFSNPTPFVQKLRSATWAGEATGVGLVEEGEVDIPFAGEQDLQVKTVTTADSDSRKSKLAEILQDKGTELKWQDRSKLHCLLFEHHDTFKLEEEEHGKMNLLQMEIDTGDEEPKSQPAHRMPFAARQEVARQLRRMQDGGVIQPSSSPWASPVVLVRKDGSLRFV